jgi:hypothetical protein
VGDDGDPEPAGFVKVEPKSGCVARKHPIVFRKDSRPNSARAAIRSVIDGASARNVVMLLEEIEDVDDEDADGDRREPLRIWRRVGMN